MKLYYISVMTQNMCKHEDLKNIFKKEKCIKLAYLFPTDFNKISNSYITNKFDLYITSKRSLQKIQKMCNSNVMLNKYLIKEWWTIEYEKDMHKDLKKSQPNFYIEF